MRYKSHFIERHDAFMSVMELNTIIAQLELAYEETRNEKVWLSLRMLKGKQQAVRDDEAYWNDADLQEILNHPGLYPHAVVSWATFYRDRDMDIS